MNTRQVSNLALSKRVYSFITSTPPAPPLATPSPSLVELTTQLRNAIARAEGAASVQQSGNTMVCTSQYAALRRTLRVRHMIPIRHVARVLARHTPGLGNLVQLHKKSSGIAALLAAAHAAVTDVAPYQAAFIAKGLAPDFIARLAAAIAAVEQAAETSLAARRQSMSATAVLESAMTDCRDTITSIGHVVQEACDQDPVNGAATRSTWEQIQRIHSGSAAPLPEVVLTVQSQGVSPAHNSVPMPLAA